MSLDQKALLQPTNIEYTWLETLVFTTFFPLFWLFYSLPLTAYGTIYFNASPSFHRPTSQPSARRSRADSRARWPRGSWSRPFSWMRRSHNRQKMLKNCVGFVVSMDVCLKNNSFFWRFFENIEFQDAWRQKKHKVGEALVLVVKHLVWKTLLPSTYGSTASKFYPFGMWSWSNSIETSAAQSTFRSFLAHSNEPCGCLDPRGENPCAEQWVQQKIKMVGRPGKR